jgi:alpha-amylase/alpha-mannosidase (GH57 family)
MADVALAFLWHQHQPYYPDDVNGENPMPWVRLHGIKDYYGMAMHLLEFPEMRCTINLVPSLLVQLQAYVERGATDRFLTLARRPADGLTQADCLFLLDHFFMANPDQMILPFRRYAELYHRRALDKDTAGDALRRFQARDLRDLQVWFHLAWTHPIAFEKDPALEELRDQGRDYTEADKNLLLDRQQAILAQVIPLHRELAERGQVELTTTPFYHPILPLLLDKKLAREALPEVKLPHYTGGYPDDAAEQVRSAIAFHTQLFGKPPIGMWPSEGSVCQPMIPLLADHGIRWFATDEEILSASTQGFVSRDDRGHPRNPDQMYRPYRVAEAGRELSMVFRDHALSDRIGFHYSRSDPIAAADDFVGHILSIGQAVRSEGPALVSVILDGENCWEYYPQGGVPFLRRLYENCVKSQHVRPTKLGEFLEKHPPRDTLPRLFAGSWINHNFRIWVGHEEDNNAWDALHQAREHLRERSRQEHVGEQNLRSAWRELYIAEGSDWFWWYGDEHASAQLEVFDYLFRKHLQNIYTLLGDAPPVELGRPLSGRGQRALHTLPRSFLQVKIDGRRTFFEWLGAGKYAAQNERGTMALVTPGPLREVYFGSNPDAFLVRVDFDKPARIALADFELVRIAFREPSGYDFEIVHPGRADSQIQVRKNGVVLESQGAAMGIDHVFEVSIPFARLGLEPGRPIHFFVELVQGGQSRDRAPREATINWVRPSADFEQIMWDV